jgi:hypothetical protein
VPDSSISTQASKKYGDWIQLGTEEEKKWKNAKNETELGSGR